MTALYAASREALAEGIKSPDYQVDIMETVTHRGPVNCTCPHGERSLGVLYAVSMGRGTVRLSTTTGCPEHDACHGFTVAYRAALPSWRNPWCPIHATQNCPTEDKP